MSFAAWVLVAAQAPSSPAKPAAAPERTSGSVPLTLEMQSPVVTLVLRDKYGTPRPTRFLVDTGGGAFMLTEAVAKEIGLAVRREEAESEEGMRFAPMDTPRVEIDGFALDLAQARCGAVLDRPVVMQGCTAEGFLPAHVLARHHVIFDYLAGRFTLARPGALEPRGTPVPSPIQAQNGFPRIELTVRGEKLGFLLDTGASFTMISLAQLERWRAAEPSLRAMTGAVCEANMVGGAMEAQALLMRIPTLTWGTHVLEGVAAVSRPVGTFETWMSQMMSAPIVGALGGNVLKSFRVEIDYAKGTTYVEPMPEWIPTILDGVGLVLGETEDGSQRVDALAQAEGKVLCEGVQVGDLVRAIDGKSIAGLRHRQVIAHLRGAPGTTHTLTLERAGEPPTRIERTLSVQRFLEPAPK